jgi:hypothetical protein
MRSRAFFAFGIGTTLVACGAGGGPEATPSPTLTPDASAQDAFAEIPVDDGFGLGCDPACSVDETCSVSGRCIAKGTCEAAGDCPVGTICGEDKTCKAGGECGSQKAVATRVPPNLLIVLDRSCSMGKAKWKAAVDAITAVTTKFKGNIRFGLTLFPDLDKPDCAQGAIPVPIAEGADRKIQSLLTNALDENDRYSPTKGPCVTNIDTAIAQAQAAPELKDPTRPNYVLLVTDGKQSGSCDPTKDANTRIEATLEQMKTAGLKTFVVGFMAGADAAILDKFAVAGGVPAAGATKFYNATDAAALATALDTIGAATLSCTFALDKAPPDPTKIFVFFDGTKEVAKDPKNGWTYDATSNSVTLEGDACTSLKNGTAKSVDVVLGCKGPQ